MRMVLTIVATLSPDLAGLGKDIQADNTDAKLVAIDSSDDDTIFTIIPSSPTASHSSVFAMILSLC